MPDIGEDTGTRSIAKDQILYFTILSFYTFRIRLLTVLSLVMLRAPLIVLSSTLPFTVCPTARPGPGAR